MSLFNFIKSFLEENPDLNIVNDFTNPLEYSALYDIFRNRQKRFEIESFLSPMFNHDIIRCSKTIKEYEELTSKVRQISQIAQKLFSLTLLNDKLEREKLAENIIEGTKKYEDKLYSNKKI